jgi:hypothetical protein
MTMEDASMKEATHTVDNLVIGGGLAGRANAS